MASGRVPKIVITFTPTPANLTLSQEVILIVDYILRQILIRIPDNKPIVGHIKHTIKLMAFVKDQQICFFA